MHGRNVTADLKIISTDEKLFKVEEIMVIFCNLHELWERLLGVLSS